MMSRLLERSNRMRIALGVIIRHRPMRAALFSAALVFAFAGMWTHDVRFGAAAWFFLVLEIQNHVGWLSRRVRTLEGVAGILIRERDAALAQRQEIERRIVARAGRGCSACLGIYSCAVCDAREVPT